MIDGYLDWQRDLKIGGGPRARAHGYALGTLALALNPARAAAVCWVRSDGGTCRASPAGR
jgi:hypothetical protein